MIKTKLFLLFAVFINLSAFGQLCQGSLGDPIVNITFGHGFGPGPKLPASVTNYNYVDTDCPQDGNYTIRNGTSSCFGSTWHRLLTDHTLDPGGYFMLVNASFEPKDFYTDTVELFCSNTTYEFAAWVINMMRTATCNGQTTLVPNLTFRIEKTDGTVLQRYDTGDIPVSGSTNWIQYGFYFTAPPDVTRVVLRITNNANGGCGNDLGIDDITFKPCGPLVNATIVGSDITKYVCAGSTEVVQLTGTISAGFDDPFIQWQRRLEGEKEWKDLPAANKMSESLLIDPTVPAGMDQYRLTVAKKENRNSPKCRITSGPLTIHVRPVPVVSLVSNSPVCQNSTLSLEAKGGLVYYWSGPDGFAASGATATIPRIQPGAAGNYLVEAINEAGCSVKDSVRVTVKPGPTALLNTTEATICEGQTVQLTASGGTGYQWRPATGLSSAGIASPLASPSDSTRYTVIVSNSSSCRDTIQVQVNVFKKPVARAGPDQEILSGQSTQLFAEVRGSLASFSWSPVYGLDDNVLLHPTASPLKDTAYVLTVVSGAGCGSARDTVKVRVYKDIYVPSGFTPNGDGKNDTWRVAGISGFREKEVTVYNRYGQVVFKTLSNQAWDGRFQGKLLPSGVYPYTVAVRGTSIYRKGWVALIR
jgi:gliding motility-associated-like protein